MRGSGEQKRDFSARDRWLNLSVWGGPIAALANLTINYSLVTEACERGTKAMLHGITAAFVVMALGSALVAWRYYRQCEGAESLEAERTRWVALVAIILSVSSAVIIIAMEVPNLILRSCD